MKAMKAKKVIGARKATKGNKAVGNKATKAKPMKAKKAMKAMKASKPRRSAALKSQAESHSWPKRVIAVGTGTIGASWAAWYALEGFDVTLFDIDEHIRQAGLNRAKTYVHELCSLGVVTAKRCRAAIQRLTVCNALAEGARNADLVVESVLEEYSVKEKVLQDLEACIGAEVPIYSSTSGLLCSRLQEVMSTPQRLVIAHPFNPPHLIPLVELVPGSQTSSAVVEAAQKFFEAHDKAPVILNKEVPGHIANRLAAAVWREALDLVHKGVASVEDVDRALSEGPGVRWALMGQHLVFDLGGGDGGYINFINGIGKTFDAYWSTMADWHSIPDEAKDKALQGMKTYLTSLKRDRSSIPAWRNRGIVRILAAKRAEKLRQ